METLSLPLWSALPFAGLLLSIAILPLKASHFWEKNRNKLAVALLFSAPVLAIFVPHQTGPLLHSLVEYTSFIILLGSLFVISGGIRLTGDLRALPAINTTFLAIGALLANFIGTTGASMLLVRPFLKTNSERHHVFHIPVFFIFVVSNIGGLLTPLGDPPLFLGYLRGVPFFWTLRLFPQWLVAVGLVLLVFFIWDSLAYRKETAVDIVEDVIQEQPLKIEGVRNFVFLLGVVGSVFLQTPLREIGMLLMAGLSLITTPKLVRQENGFGWNPIKEVAILFLGIFITMVPALILLEKHGAESGITQPWQFFWLTGGLSSLLDNAPTYLAFVSLAQGLHLSPEVISIPAKLLAAISCGAVFMGANSYIGNGPNFMVKAIAEEMGFKTPSFLGYMFYSGLILLPVFGLITLIFFL
ncbi:MAG: sodium:proton antiporter [Deltaproteobacteria bacterium]|nr:sodium:proton antiporter [Deltaproteobacteria bacterium]